MVGGHNGLFTAFYLAEGSGFESPLSTLSREIFTSLAARPITKEFPSRDLSWLHPGCHSAGGQLRPGRVRDMQLERNGLRSLNLIQFGTTGAVTRCRGIISYADTKRAARKSVKIFGEGCPQVSEFQQSPGEKKLAGSSMKVLKQVPIQTSINISQ